MKKIILCGLLTCSFTNAEIVKNAKGENVELRKDGTWVLVPKTFNGFVNDEVPYLIELADGSESKVAITVYPKITLMDEGRKLTRDEINHEIFVISVIAQFGLKNRSSFQPKEVNVIQRGREVDIRLSFTSQNEYGAEVSNVRTGKYYIAGNNELKRAALAPAKERFSGS